ncbi:hypothetical protein [Acetobacter nitrogenifigens]|uniref:hypothetical protein n=1 Tax=Acetobacter nitrogenifigens TaxID=285268 RepID=UPI001FEF7085|nr:hypothetical protein [Acetobacter nitrogenifigens]
MRSACGVIAAHGDILVDHAVTAHVYSRNHTQDAGDGVRAHSGNLVACDDLRICRKFAFTLRFARRGRCYGFSEHRFERVVIDCLGLSAGGLCVDHDSGHHGGRQQ